MEEEDRVVHKHPSKGLLKESINYLLKLMLMKRKVEKLHKIQLTLMKLDNLKGAKNINPYHKKSRMFKIF